VTGRTIAKVEFFQGSTLLGAATSSPFSYTWTNVSGGSYSLTAKATDSAGVTSTSTPPVNIRVNSGASGSTTVTLFPTQDTFLNINTDIGIASATLNLYTWPANKIANVIVMKFDLSSIPVGATINDAELNLYQVQSDTYNEPADPPTSTADATYIVGAHKLTVNPNLALATGFTYDGTNPWTPNDCCYNSIPIAQSDITPAYATNELDQANGFKTWNIKTMVQEWMKTPASNYGVLLNSDPTKRADRFRAFASMEDLTPSRRPYLQVGYTAATSAGTSLAVTRSGNNVVISWPATATGYVLEFTPSLVPATWSLVTTPQVIVGDRVTVTVAASGKTTFYRLRK
jgi:hypothetical protein